MIDYKLIDDSINYYNSSGFSRIETPWLVTEAVDSITRPEHIKPYTVERKQKNLIASGEQGFLYLYLKEYLPKGKFQTVTPCIRDESFDFTHTKYFIKNELIITDEVNESTLMELIKTSRVFFQQYFKQKINIIKDGDGYDLVVGGHELGSYGIRKHSFIEWIYGTGCAEPRTSRLIKTL